MFSHKSTVFFHCPSGCTFADVMADPISLRGHSLSADVPRIMGILNATPDSFHAGSRVSGALAANQALQMVSEGASLLDLGGQSSRPGAERIGPAAEWQRIQPALESIREVLPDVPISVDTFHAEVARRALDAGADMINDISAGALDPELPVLVAERQVPYAIMHMQGTPETMQDRPGTATSSKTSCRISRNAGTASGPWASTN